jgi:hypothetical protein
MPKCDLVRLYFLFFKCGMHSSFKSALFIMTFHRYCFTDDCRVFHCDSDMFRPIYSVSNTNAIYEKNELKLYFFTLAFRCKSYKRVFTNTLWPFIKCIIIILNLVCLFVAGTANLANP